MRNWYRNGADVPEQLSRFLFLEEALPGRRVLYVGAAGSELEEALVELGAKSVVCVADPYDGGGAELSARAPSEVPSSNPSWPGQEGAFDLIVDFGLAAAIERGETWRLQEIQRLLSDDGFALAAWHTGESPGLARFFSGPTEPVAAGPGEPEDARLAYGDWVRLLLDQFELVEVYFQTLLLGYFFGSFELDTSDDGIAPHTGLMGSEPEPAAHYLFAFGNAVPFLQDASLVQLPLMDLYRTWDRAGAAPALGPAARVEHENTSFRAPTLEHAEPKLAASDRDELLGRCAELEAEARARNQEIRRLDAEKNAAYATLHEIEAELRRSVELQAQAEQQNVAVRLEVDALRAALTAAEAKRSEDPPAADADFSEYTRWRDERQRLRHRARLLEERMHSLQSKLASVSAERDHAREEAILLGEELDARASGGTAGPLSSAAVPNATPQAEKNETSFDSHLLEAEQRGMGDEGAAHFKALLQEKEAALARLAKGVNTLMHERDQQQQEWQAERSEHEQALAVERTKAAQAAQETASLRSQLEQMQASFVERTQSAKAEQAAWKAMRERAEKAESALTEIESRLRTAQAALENRSRQAGVAQQAFHEAAAQRDTLQRVLAARDQEAAAMREELADALAELERVTHMHKAAAVWEEHVPDAEALAAAQGGAEISHATAGEQALRSQLELQSELLHEARREHERVQDAYELTRVLLDEARYEFARVNSAYELTRALLDEARRDHGKLSAESELLHSLLDEARSSHERVQAEADLADALLEEARATHERAAGSPGSPEPAPAGDLPSAARSGIAPVEGGSGEDVALPRGLDEANHPEGAPHADPHASN